MFIEIWTYELVIKILKISNSKKRKLDKMTISNFERLSGDIVQRDMSPVWWGCLTNNNNNILHLL